MTTFLIPPSKGNRSPSAIPARKLLFFSCRNGHRCKKVCAGWTLVELLTTATIIGLLATTAMPSLYGWLNRVSESALLRQLNQAATFARTRAVRDRQYFTVCASEDKIHCTSRWRRHIIVFSDANRNETLDGPDQLYRAFPLKEGAPCVQWRGSAGRHYLQFKPSGASNGTAGHFRLCDADAKDRRRLVVSLSGRTALRGL